MLAINAYSADAAWQELASRLRDEGKVQEGRDQPTRELLHVGFSISDPRQRLVFARPMNPAFAVAEVIWMLSGFNDVEWLAWWNPRVRRLAADEGNPAFHGAYGDRLGSRPRLGHGMARRLRHRSIQSSRHLDQLKTATQALRADPTSRQVVLQIWDADRDLPNPISRSRDIPCNLVSHLLIRDGRLVWLQVMRSNDLMWGLPYNIVQFTMLQEILAGWLGIEVGSYQHVSNSLHAYERHWKELDALILNTGGGPRNSSDLRISDYDAWQEAWSRLVDCVGQIMRLEVRRQLEDVPKRYADLPGAYREWIALLTAEALRKMAEPQAADDVVQVAGPFWSWSWRQWAEAESRRREPGGGSAVVRE
ncbi:MAG: thymidylate synthase [Thermomicrobiales bacterium]